MPDKKITIMYYLIYFAIFTNQSSHRGFFLVLHEFL